MKFTTGSVFGNRYTLGDRIAVGGMGEVWRATDRVLGRVVAIKLLSPSLAGQPGFTQRFREEARNTAALSHGNIAALYDYGEDDGASWLVMELVEGEPLSQIIKDEGPLDPARVSSIMGQAADALQAAHDAGVIHRDVKPANILVRHDGVVKLTDFGIARAVDAVPITRTGEVMGTAQYISPEQAMGRHVGPASDVYALGAVAHEMLTGRRAFDEGSPVATAMAHIHNPAPPLPTSVPQPLAGVVMACLAKDPSLRPPSARDVALALAGQSAAVTRTQRLGERAARTERLGTARRAAVPAAAGAGSTTGLRLGDEDGAEKKRGPWIWLVPLLLVLALVGWGLFQFGPGREPSPTPTTTRVITPSSTPTATSSARTVEVNRDDLVGQSFASASTALRQLGLVPVAREVDSDRPAGEVLDVAPTGDAIARGTTITLDVSRGPQQTTPATTPTPTRTSAPAPTPTSQAPSTSKPETSDAPETSDTPQQDPTGGSAGNNAPVPPRTSEAPADDSDDASGADGSSGDSASADGAVPEGTGANGSGQARPVQVQGGAGTDGTVENAGGGDAS
ncbi:protein kinase domain-containing protein [Agilicoccus flavus]|uniref:protein kinase domain-containing protein n=1 Tax=Agilicoccus flavus TaxID=2775968 RepID=UPI001CF63932|nr:protein kinase [Agilicoccus flavus]